MSGTFLAVVFIALVLLAFWRVVLLLFLAVLIAVMVLGVDAVGHEVSLPAPPSSSTDGGGAAADPADPPR